MDTINTSCQVPPAVKSYSSIAQTSAATGKRVRFSLPPPTAHIENVSNRLRGQTHPSPTPRHAFPALPARVAQELRTTIQKLDFTKVVVPHAGPLKSPRSIAAGDENIGATRQLSLELGMPLDASVSLKDTANIHASQICDAIRDDATRRILFLYFQLLAYWKEGCQISLGPTLIQYGMSMSPRCSGAHAALLPHLVDNHLEVLGQQIAKGGITESVEVRMLSLGFSQEQILQIKHAAVSLEAFKEVIKQFPEETSLLGDKVYLYHSSACVIEMPSYVNNLHALFEEQLRNEALKHLNDVSLRGDDPYKCLEELCSFLEEFLKAAEHQTAEKIRLVQKLVQLEPEWKKLQLQSLDNKVADKEAFMREYLRIGATIVETVKLIKQLNGKSLGASTTHLGEYFAFVNTHTSLLSRRSDIPSRSRSRSAKITPIKERFEDAYAQLSSDLARQGAIQQSKLDEALSNLENSSVVIHLLRKHSDCPPKHVLSGRCVDGKWMPFTLEEIIKQKYEIISNRTLDVTITKTQEAPAR
ncbi:MAG: hypothetical protein Q8K75_01140 [Chlamydiales bacterium]|nr:hypothetical protein [Chlamydiales bacterium]